MPAPIWLADEPEITAVLHAVVDRFDQQRGAERSRDVFVSVASALPSLASSDTQADQKWLLVRSLADAGLLKIKTSKRSPYDPEWVSAKLAFPPASEDTLRSWLDREPATRAIEHWRAAVQAHAHAFADGLDLLNARRIHVPSRSAEEIVAALASIRTIQGPITLRQLSARIFWGDSKVLDQRGELIIALFPALIIRERPIVVAVHLPHEYQGVLFIENQDTYAAAVRSSGAEMRGLAFVYASGFRSSAVRVRSREGAILHFSGPATARLSERFEQWWFSEAEIVIPAWFWGDLDFAGMQILKSLRDRFAPMSAWSYGYDRMLPLARGASALHLNARDQIDPISTGDTYADTVLLPAIRECGFVDQESIDIF
jgi:hypothetical protein